MYVEPYRQVLTLYAVLLLPDRDNKDTDEIELQPPVAKKAKTTESMSMPSTSASTSISTPSNVTAAEIKPPTSSAACSAPSPLFYLTKVRGIPDHYNNPSMATGIKGAWYLYNCILCQLIMDMVRELHMHCQCSILAMQEL